MPVYRFDINIFEKPIIKPTLSPSKSANWLMILFTKKLEGCLKLQYPESSQVSYTREIP